MRSEMSRPAFAAALSIARWIGVLGLGVALAACGTVRPSSGEEFDPVATLTFCINVHDFFHVGESADTLLRLIDLFERYGVRGDFYLTAPMVHGYAEERPEVIERLRESGMTISTHVRPPHPAYRGFDALLEGISPAALERVLRDYETYRLDLATGGLVLDDVGGIACFEAFFEAPPVVASVPFERWRPALLPIWSDLGVRMTVTYHETGTDVEEPFVWRDGLLIRPSDFSITRWSVRPEQEPQFWWNMLDTPLADRYVPVERLREELDDWSETRAPFVTVLIHENNFTRRAATPWANVYYSDEKKATPLEPPFDLDAPDASEPRTAENIEAIWEAYEALIAYASENLRVLTSAEIVRLAEAAAD